jgi:hypothetical protein
MMHCQKNIKILYSCYNLHFTTLNVTFNVAVFKFVIHFV